MADPGDAIGSAGTLIGAALETAGHYMQSQMIDVIQQSLEKPLGGLLYTIAVISALFIIAVGGKYKFGLWLLFGPPVFFFLIHTRTPSDGASWRFGEHTHPQEQVFQVTQFARGNADSGHSTTERPKAQVATFFALWNELTSGGIQSFISLVNLTKQQTATDVHFVAAVERWSLFQNIKILDPGVGMFVNLTAVNQCRDYYAFMNAQFNLGYNKLARDKYKAAAEEAMKKSNFSFKEYPELVKWMKEFKPKGKGNSGKPLFDDIQKVTGKSWDQNMNCGDLWKLAAEAIKYDSSVIVDLVAAQGMPGGLEQNERDQFLNQSKLRLAQRVNYKNHDINGNRVDSSDTSWTQLTDDQKVVYVINELVARLLLAEMKKVSPFSSVRGLEHYVPVMEENNQDLQPEADVSRAIREQSGGEEWQSKGDFLTMMLGIPYVQGLALFFLAWSFPFFAMALVIPGRHHTLLTWMGLWFWIKSWDFGFAVVMLIHDVLYALLPQHPGISNLDLNQPDVVFRQMLQVDSSYSIHTFYNLMATCLLAVPILTGVLVKKGGGELFNSLSEALREFGGEAGGAMASYENNMLMQGLLRQASENAYQRGAKAGAVRSLADKQMMDAFGKAGLSAAAQSALGSGDAATIQGFASKLAGEAQTREKSFALSLLRRNMDFAVYQETLSEQNRMFAARAVGLRWNSHDVVREYPGGSELKVMKAGSWFGFAKPAEGSLNKVIGEITGALNPYGHPK